MKESLSSRDRADSHWRALSSLVLAHTPGLGPAGCGRAEDPVLRGPDEPVAHVRQARAGAVRDEDGTGVRRRPRRGLAPAAAGAARARSGSAPSKQQLIGVRVGAAERKAVQQTIRLLGKVAVDETRSFQVTAPSEGLDHQGHARHGGQLREAGRDVGDVLQPDVHLAPARPSATRSNTRTGCRPIRRNGSSSGPAWPSST